MRHCAFESGSGGNVWTGDGTLVEGTDLGDIRDQLRDVLADIVYAGEEIWKKVDGIVAIVGVDMCGRSGVMRGLGIA